MDFRAIVDAHYAALYRFAFSLAKNEHEAGDLVQETFLIYAEKGGSLKEASKVKSWLFTTLYREFLRVRKRGERMDSRDPEVLEAVAPVEEEAVTARMDATMVMESLQEVDEVYRVPLTLFYLQGMAYKEIAEMLRTPIGTVMSRLSRGKAQLKAILRKKGEGMENEEERE